MFGGISIEIRLVVGLLAAGWMVVISFPGFPILEVAIENEELPANLYDRNVGMINNSAEMAYGKPCQFSSFGYGQKRFAPGRLGIQHSGGFHGLLLLHGNNRPN